MLMIFVGPLISQAMPMEQHAGMRMDMDMPMSASMDTASKNISADAPSCETNHPVATDHVIWAKCGYCTLLFSCPALPQALAFIPSAPPKPSDFFSVAAQQGHARQTTFANARTRAPPLPLPR